MSTPANLSGIFPWFTRPSISGGVFGGPIAVYYGTLTLDLAGNFQLFLVVTVSVILAANAFWTYRLGKILGTVKGLSAGTLPPTKENLQAAVREAFAFPQHTFTESLLNWTVSASLAGVILWVLGDGLTWAFPTRVVMLGTLIGALSCMLIYIITVTRARTVVRRLAEAGLTIQEVIAAAPPKRQQLRGRLVAFAAVCVIVPAAATVDLSVTLQSRIVAEARQVEDPAQRKALVLARRTEALTQMGILCALVFGLSLYVAHLGGTGLGQPMSELTVQAGRLAKGDLAGARIVPAEDETWALSATFAAMHSHLSDVLSQLGRAGVRVGSTTEQILATSQRLDAGATDQATSLNETSATTEELARSGKQIAENAAQVAEIAQKTANAAQAGQVSAESFFGAMGRMREDNHAIAGAVQKLNRRVQQIGKVVAFINAVADKSDLLALSAELEGTKAGDVGRGFALVAAEMRRLAENVLESTKEIESLIEEIRDATLAAVSATDAGMKATESATALASAVRQSLDAIVRLAGATSDAVRTISLSTQQQQHGTDQLADAMLNMLMVTQKSATMTREVVAANADLAQLARQLKASVDRFRTA
jgi:methyl-accepting chemotaxis protein